MKKFGILSLVIVVWIAAVVFIFEKVHNNADTSWIKKKLLDIQYASDSHSQKLDIYYPNDGIGAYPVIIVIHGGAFKFGDKADGQLTPMLEGIKRGYAIVSINYRLSGEAKWPAQINDVKGAIKFIRANAENLNLKGDKIAVWGGSAGGNLAALAGTSGDAKLLEDPNMGFSNVSAKVQAVVDWFWPTDLTAIEKQWEVLKTNETKDEEPTGAFALIENSNPRAYINSESSPIFIQYVSTNNGTIPLKVEDFFREMKEKSKNEVLLEDIHTDKAFESKQNLDKVFAFLDRHLK